MSQHDYVLNDAAGASFRSDLNNVLAAIVSQNSGATAPSPTFAYQFWADTTAGILKQRNAANSAWVDLFSLSTGRPSGVAASGANSDITSLTALTTVPWAQIIQGFRLTLTSGDPVGATEVATATTIYCSPYGSNSIALYTGSKWEVRQSAEFSLALGTLTANMGYDVFCYDNNGTPTLELLAWSSATARATALTRQDGVLVKSGNTTRRYLGSFYTLSTTQTSDSDASRYLYNYYNRVSKRLKLFEATASWTYASTAWRQARASASNKVNFFIGVSEDVVTTQLAAYCSNSSTGGGYVAFGLDSITDPAADCASTGYVSSAGGFAGTAVANYSGYPGIGYHYLAWLEKVSSSTETFFGSGSSTQAGITGGVLC